MRDPSAIELFGIASNPLIVKKAVKDANGNITYLGYAMGKNAALDIAVWRIKKLNYDVNGDFESEQWSKVNQIMDDYATVDYGEDLT